MEKGSPDAIAAAATLLEHEDNAIRRTAVKALRDAAEKGDRLQCCTETKANKRETNRPQSEAVTAVTEEAVTATTSEQTFACWCPWHLEAHSPRHQ